MYFEDYETISDDLTVNIIDALIKEYHPEEIIMFATHQPIPFRQDTYYIAKILERKFAEQGIKSRICEYQSDPRDRDQAFLFFQKFFEENKNLKSAQAIVSGSGGVPAMKEALNFYSVMNLIEPRIVDVDENSHQVMESNIAQVYLKNFQKESLISLIAQHDYSGAYQLITANNSLIKQPQIARHLLYLSMKYNFDLEQANKYAENNNSLFPRLQLLDHGMSVEEMLSVKYQIFMLLFDNLKITYEKGEYTSLLGKVFALKENLIRYLVEDKYQIRTDNLTLQEADQLLARYPRLKEKKTPNGIVYHFDTCVLQQMITESDFFALLTVVRSLSGERNGSIMAHGF